jgi:hypothetical protein
MIIEIHQYRYTQKPTQFRHIVTIMHSIIIVKPPCFYHNFYVKKYFMGKNWVVFHTDRVRDARAKPDHIINNYVVRLTYYQ